MRQSHATEPQKQCDRAGRGHNTNATEPQKQYS